MKRFIAPISFLLTCSFANAGFTVAGGLEYFLQSSVSSNPIYAAIPQPKIFPFSPTLSVGYKFSVGAGLNAKFSYLKVDYLSSIKGTILPMLEVYSPGFKLGYVSLGLAFSGAWVSSSKLWGGKMDVLASDFRILLSREFRKGTFVGCSIGWRKFDVQISDLGVSAPLASGMLFGLGGEMCF